MDIITLGEILIDMFPSEIGRPLTEVSAFRPIPGGAPANVAVAASRLGADTAFIGKVGKDAFGYHLADILSREKVDIRGLCYSQQARTTIVFIAQPDENNAEFLFYRNPGADMLLKPEEISEGLFGETKIFHFGSLSLVDEGCRRSTEKAIALARENGALVSFDINYRPTLWKDFEQAYEVITPFFAKVDLIKANKEEITLFTDSADYRKGSEQLLDCGIWLCIVTLGDEGSYYSSGKGDGFLPAFKVDTVDATGCGDAFTAGLLTRLAAEGILAEDYSPAKIERSLVFANAVGALTAQNQGVIPALPTGEQVKLFLKEQFGGTQFARTKKPPSEKGGIKRENM